MADDNSEHDAVCGVTRAEKATTNYMNLVSFAKSVQRGISEMYEGISLRRVFLQVGKQMQDDNRIKMTIPTEHVQETWTKDDLARMIERPPSCLEIRMISADDPKAVPGRVVDSIDVKSVRPSQQPIYTIVLKERCVLGFKHSR